MENNNKHIMKDHANAKWTDEDYESHWDNEVQSGSKLWMVVIAGVIMICVAALFGFTRDQDNLTSSKSIPGDVAPFLSFMRSNNKKVEGK